MLENRVKPIVYYLNNKKYICGAKVTYPDFLLFELIDLMEWVTQGMLLSRYTGLVEYYNRVKSLPRLEEYYNGDESTGCLKRPFFTKIAKLNN